MLGKLRFLLAMIVGKVLEWGLRVFTGRGTNTPGIIMQKICPMENNAFTVVFLNADTDSLSPGSYSWDVRYVINPYYDDSGKMVDGDQVLTPRTPMSMNLLTVVGDV